MAKHSRPSAAQEIYRELYAGSPNAYLILSPDLKIIDGNDAFVTMTRINRDMFAGRYIFDAFPDNPEPENTGVKNLKESFQRVLTSHRADTLRCQRYDVKNQDGVWEKRRFNGTSWAVTDDKKSITAVILHVHEVTSDEIATLFNEASEQLEKSKKLVNTGKQLVDEVERLVTGTKQDQLKTLREMLKEFATIH